MRNHPHSLNLVGIKSCNINECLQMLNLVSEATIISLMIMYKFNLGILTNNYLFIYFNMIIINHWWNSSDERISQR